MPDISNLDDPFLSQRLNPLLLENVKGYWKALTEAKVSEEERLQIREALFNLVRFVFRHLFQPLYLKYSPHMQGSIYLLSAVHSDGIGDYMTTLKCAKLLKEAHPEINVHVAYTHKQKLPEVNPGDYLLKKENIHSFLETEDPSSMILGNVLEGKPSLSFVEDLKKLQKEKEKILQEYEALKDHHPQAALAIKELADEADKPLRKLQYFLQKKEEASEIYEALKKSLALIHIALAINTFDNSELAPKSLYFAESGNFQGIGNYLQRNWFSMGLDPFEEGIFLRKENLSKEWVFTKLSHYLFKAEQPAQEQIKQYQNAHSLQIGYLTRIPEQRHLFIEMICRRYIHDHRHIDILLPQQDNESLHDFDRDWLTANGISKVLSVECASTIKEHIIAQIELPGEKQLRLIHSLPVPSSDFIKFIDLAGEIIGCTGDGSLSDCLMAGRIPFYEVRRHKLRTISAFRHLARILTLPDVMDYFEQLELFADYPAISFLEKFERILNNGAFKAQWKELIEFIRRHYCFEDSFISHVNRHLFAAQTWEVIEKEEMLIQDYFEHSISAEEAYQTFEMMLKNRIG